MINNDDIKNRTIFIRDNLDVMRGMDSESIDLIYLDPPFKKNDTFVIKDKTKSKIQTIKEHFINQQKSHGWHEGVDFESIFQDERVGFSDRWAGSRRKERDDLWHETDINVGWQVLLARKDKRITDYISSIRKTASSGMYYYLSFMAVRLIEMHRLLKPTGSLYLHCDPTASHYLKGVLDIVFGHKNFRNEIVWCYRGGGVPRSDFANKHDIIMRYSKSNDYYFNPDEVRIPYSEESIDRLKYTARAFRGEKVYDNYAPHEGGKHPEDWWVMQPIMPSSKERIGYPTQKPVKLMERIIQASSNEGDVVLDPFCGCATTLVAAQKLFRHWIGIDKNPQAYWLLKYRFEERKETAVSDKLMQHETERGYTKEQQEQREQLILRTEVPTRTDGGAAEEPTPSEAEMAALRREKKSQLTREEKKIARELFYENQNGVCNGCLTCKELADMHLDHIVPISKDGTDDLDNLQVLCGSCNQRKSDGTMVDLLKRLLEDGRLKEYQYKLQMKRYASASS